MASVCASLCQATMMNVSWGRSAALVYIKSAKMYQWNSNVFKNGFYSNILPTMCQVLGLMIQNISIEQCCEQLNNGNVCNV